MANNFPKAITVAFENMLVAFDGAIDIVEHIETYRMDPVLAERSNNTFWRPVPGIARVQDVVIGVPITFQTMNQLSVPTSCDGYFKTASWTMNANELNDPVQQEREMQSARDSLASAIHQSIIDVASSNATVVVPIPAASGNYDDVAACDTIFTEQGIPMADRHLALSTRDYSGLASDLAVASRSFGNAKTDMAYERGVVGPVSGFTTFKLNYAKRIAAAAGVGVTMNTTLAANVNYVPVATILTSGQRLNVDNRTQSVAFNTTAGMAAGDMLTIGGVEAAHHITKTTTGRPKTFRVISITNGTVAVISPPIISGGGATDAELQYKNVVLASTGAAAAVTFLNVNASHINPFWTRGAIEICPGRVAVPDSAGADVMRATTRSGIDIVLIRQYSLQKGETQYRCDSKWGVNAVDPEKIGALLFNQ